MDKERTDKITVESVFTYLQAFVSSAIWYWQKYHGFEIPIFEMKIG